MTLATTTQGAWRGLIAAGLLLSGAACAATVTFTLSDFTSSVSTNRAVMITPLAITAPETTVAAYDKRLFRSDSNGQFVVSNMLAGTYQVDIQAPPSLTSVRLQILSNDTAVAAGSRLVAATNQVYAPGTVAWSTSASDARYAPLGSLTAPNASFATNATYAAYATNVLNAPTNVLVNGSTNPHFSGGIVIDYDPDTYYSTIDLGGGYGAQLDYPGGDFLRLVFGTNSLAVWSDRVATTNAIHAGRFAGDGSALTGLNRAPSLPVAVSGVAAFGNGWALGTSGNCGTTTPPYEAVTNWWRLGSGWSTNILTINHATWVQLGPLLSNHLSLTTNLTFFQASASADPADFTCISNMVAAVSNRNNLWIVQSIPDLSMTNGGPVATQVTNWENWVAALVGNHFVQTRAYLQTKGTGNSNDNWYVSHGLIPESLYCSNSIAEAHLTATGYQYEGEAIAIGMSNAIYIPSIVLTNGARGVTLSGTFNGNAGGLTNLQSTNLTGLIRTEGSNVMFTGKLMVTNGLQIVNPANGESVEMTSGVTYWDTAGLMVSLSVEAGAFGLRNGLWYVDEDGNTVGTGSISSSGGFFGNGAGLTNLVLSAGASLTNANAYGLTNWGSTGQTNYTTTSPAGWLQTNTSAGTFTRIQMGNVVTSGTFTGNGAGLTNLPAAQVSGTFAGLTSSNGAVAIYTPGVVNPFSIYHTNSSTTPRIHIQTNGVVTMGYAPNAAPVTAAYGLSVSGFLHTGSGIFAAGDIASTSASGSFTMAGLGSVIKWPNFVLTNQWNGLLQCGLYATNGLATGMLVASNGMVVAGSSSATNWLQVTNTGVIVTNVNTRAVASYLGGWSCNRTNVWTTNELSVGSFGEWNSNSTGTIYMSINVSGVITNKLLLP